MTHEQILDAIEAAMKMHFLARRLPLTAEARSHIKLCRRDPLTHMPSSNPTRQQIKDGVEWYFASLGETNQPLPLEIKAYYANLNA